MSYLENYGMLTLRKGSGGSYDNGLCVMEAVAWLNGEEATDQPKCACPLLGSFAIYVNDKLPDDDRQKLLPLALSLVSTRSEEHIDVRFNHMLKRVEKIFGEIISFNPCDDVANIDYGRAEYIIKQARQERSSEFRHYYMMGSRLSLALNELKYLTKDGKILLEGVNILKEAIALGPNSSDELELYLPQIKALGEFSKTLEKV